jgi:hypothetical protein
MYKSIICIALIVVCCTTIAHTQTIHISSAANLQVVNRNISVYDSVKRTIVHLDAREGDGVAWIKNASFTTGTIEFDAKGKDVLQQSFIGIAFHAKNDSSFDVIYFRPFNFRSPDTIRKSHSVQYVCMPKYDWYYLRENHPGKYENALAQTVEPTSWFHAKVVVSKNNIEVYVNGDKKPSLSVQPLADYSEGNVGFWVGNNSDGDFSNITIKQD